MTKKKAKSKKVKKTSRKKTSKPAESSKEILLMEMDADCFNKEFLDTRGFQYRDLRPQYRKVFDKAFCQHKDNLIIRPTGNPGISLFLQIKK